MKYQEYEKAVYNWLTEKHRKDNTFTFSVRMQANKGAESDYFIGTKKSNYFGTTFWTIPVGFPGSSGDCFNLIFKQKKGLLNYRLEFKQTNKPKGGQNKSVLSLFKAIENDIDKALGIRYVSPATNAIFKITPKPRNTDYQNLNNMLEDISIDLDIIIPIVDEAIKKEKQKNKNFIAHRITTEEFDTMINNMEKRIKKHQTSSSNINYWIFQGSPEIYDIAKALKGGHLKSWKVAAHKDKIKIGDKVIIWQTGNNAGCYSLAEVISEVGIIEEEDFEKQYYKVENDNEASERVKLKIIHYLADNPVLWSEIKNDVNFTAFKAGNQGTNFSATEEEYNAIKDIFENTGNFQENLKLFSNEEINLFTDRIVETINHFQIQAGDPRIVFGCTNTGILNYTIGQRYCLSLRKKNNKTSFGIITLEKYNVKDKQYSGGTEAVYYHSNNDLNELSILNKESYLQAMNYELNRSKKSGFLKYSNREFEDYIYKNIIKDLQRKIEHTDTQKEEVMNNKALNQILYGPPGTGKTYKTKQLAVEIANNEWYKNLENLSNEERRKEILKEYDKRCLSEQIVFTTFHQSMSYEDFVEGIKPKTEDNQVIYEIEEGIFKEIVEKAKYTSHTNFDEAYDQLIEFISKKDNDFLILKTPRNREFRVNLNSNLNLSLYTTDEIKLQGTLTRKKLNKHFIGEDSFKGWEGYATGVINFLTENFGLSSTENKEPKNYVLIIDEINRANVSAVFGELITLLEPDKRLGENEVITLKLPYSKTDFGVPPNLYIIGTMNTADRSVEALDTALRRRFEFEEIMPNPELLKKEFKEFSLKEVLETINNRIEVLLDRDHTIGHSYFMKVKNDKDLRNVFKNNIIPLLQEYFYGDYDKIAMVLGIDFLKKPKTYEKDIFAYHPKNSDFERVEILELKKIDEDFNILDAVKKLLNKKSEDTSSTENA